MFANYLTGFLLKTFSSQHLSQEVLVDIPDVPTQWTLQFPPKLVCEFLLWQPDWKLKKWHPGGNKLDFFLVNDGMREQRVSFTISPRLSFFLPTDAEARRLTSFLGFLDWTDKELTVLVAISFKWDQHKAKPVGKVIKYQTSLYLFVFIIPSWQKSTVSIGPLNSVSQHRFWVQNLT